MSKSVSILYDSKYFILQMKYRVNPLIGHQKCGRKIVCLNPYPPKCTPSFQHSHRFSIDKLDSTLFSICGAHFIIGKMGGMDK